ncbi:MAG: MFS transporter [Chloroflexales bacterium]|nr:MFS transporter [Chloroflexales bacterium]
MADIPSPLDGASNAPPTDGLAPHPLLLIMLQLAVLLVAAEARMIVPLLPAIAADLHITIGAAGLLISAYALPYGLFQLVYGPLADRFSRQRVMGVALGLFALGTVACGLAPSNDVLTIVRFCTGAAGAGVVPVALAYIADLVPYEQRQAALGRIISVASLGGVISAALGGIVATLVSWHALFLGYGALALLTALVLLQIPVRQARPAVPQRVGLLAPYRALIAQGGWRMVALFGLVGFEGFAAISTLSYAGTLLAARDQLSYGAIGGLLMLNGVGTMLAARMVGRMVGRLGEGGLVRLGGALMALSYVLMALSPTLVYFPLAMLLSGAGFALAHSTLQTRATELAPAQRGTAIALFAFALLLGSGLGTFVAGQAIERVGFTPTLLGTALALALFVAIAGPLLRHSRAQSV